MQPILAESAPHRGRLVAVAAALAVVATLVISTTGRGHHRERRHWTAHGCHRMHVAP